MRPSTCLRLLTCTSALLTGTLSAQITLSPMTTFGGGDGWLAPNEGGYAFLGTGSFERGLAYNPINNHIYLVSRAVGTTVRILDGTTGTELGTLSTTGISGGTFALNKVVVDLGTGTIYAANLRTGMSDPGFRLYRWANEASAPTMVFDLIPDTGNPRAGDNLDLFGTGANAQIVAGYGTVTTAPLSNGYLVIDPTKSALSPTTPAYNNVDFATGTVNGDFRLGITFLGAANADSGIILGTQGTTVTSPKLTSYTGAIDDGLTLAGVLAGNVGLTSSTERAFDYTEFAGIGLLATLELSGAGSMVRLYDATNPAAPTLLSSLTTTSGTTNANGNAGGDIRFGLAGVDGNNNPTVTLYAMNTNNGIQAFVVSVPEPSTALMLGVGVVALGARRRRQRS